MRNKKQSYYAQILNAIRWVGELQAIRMVLKIEHGVRKIPKPQPEATTCTYMHIIWLFHGSHMP